LGTPIVIQSLFRRPFSVMMALLLAGVLVFFPAVRNTHPAADRLLKIVVIDPGHGGRESGAIGPGGTAEKGVTLALAQQIREVLADRYRTVLTRSDDYWMDVTARAATANHHRADLFISLHAGGGFEANLDGISVSIFGGVAGEPGGTDSSEHLKTGLVPWELGYLRHVPENRRLASVLRRSLSKQFTSRPVSLVEAPLAVLAGADMPAALIEIGYLTHPARELHLKETSRMADFARAIAGGIDDFFAK